MAHPTRGFTLIEFLAFLAGIGLLSAFALGGLMQSRTDARDAKRITGVADIALALRAYKFDHKEYPSSLSVLPAGGYISSIPRDPISKSEPWYEVLVEGALVATDLESPHNLLKTDADAKSNSINGNDGAGCDGTIAKFCFDIFLPL